MDPLRRSWVDRLGRSLTHPDTSTETLTYDNNGNLTQTINNTTGETTTYEWDCFDRLTKVTLPPKYGAEAGEEISFTYGGDHKLTKIDYPDMNVDIVQSGIDTVRKVAHIRFNGMKTPTETDITTHLVHIWGQLLGQYNSAPGSGTPQYYHYDHNNNLALTTDQQGNIQEKPLMDAYGNVLPLPDSSGNKEALTLSSNLLTGGAGVFYIQRAKMFNMRRRFYNSFLRRFNSVDPFKMGVNYFSYTDNNPLGYMDASGLAKIQSETFDIFNKPKAEENKEGNKDAWIRRLNKANEFVPRILSTDRCLNAFYEYGPGGLSKKDYRILNQWNNISISFKWTDAKFINLRQGSYSKYKSSLEFAFVPAEASDYDKIMISLQMITNYNAPFLNQVLIHELAHTVGVPGDISYKELISDQYHVCCEIISWECLGLSAKDSFHLKANWPERTRWWIYKLYGYSYIEWMELRNLSLLIPSKVSNENNRFDLEDRVNFYGQFNEYKTLAKAKKACKCLKKYADSFPKNYNTYVQNFYNRYIKERK